MKNTKITLQNTAGQSETRKALEWSLQKVDQCETIDELKAVWNQFYALQGTWQFQLKCKMKKNEILTHVENS
jgi:hypothetical protein